MGGPTENLNLVNQQQPTDDAHDFLLLLLPVTAAERSIGSLYIQNWKLPSRPCSPSSSCSSVFLCFFLPSDAYYAIVVKKDNFDAPLFDQLKSFVHLTASHH